MLTRRPPPTLKLLAKWPSSAGDGFVLLVDPDGAGEFMEDGFAGGVGFGPGVAGEVDGDGGAVVDELAAGVGEGAELEHAGEGDLVLAVGVGLVALCVGFVAAFFGFGDFLVDALVFFFLFFGGEVFAVFFEQAGYADAVEPEDFEFAGVVFLGVAVAVEAVERGGLAVDVVLLPGFGGALVALRPGA